MPQLQDGVWTRRLNACFETFAKATISLRQQGSAAHHGHIRRSDHSGDTCDSGVHLFSAAIGVGKAHRTPAAATRSSRCGGVPGARRRAKASRDNIVTLAAPWRQGGRARRRPRRLARARPWSMNWPSRVPSSMPGFARSSPPTRASSRAPFIDGAKMAYEMIVTAFADGDRKALRNLLSREVFDGFSAPSPIANPRANRYARLSWASIRPRSSAPSSCAAMRR